ncbi:MAG: DnaA regulatory inactivator Hda [Woeseia sp.]|nr:DnaA regulatory inactivator Hda [Woeseia sp.]MBT8095463.1 DnaA regulatory inactivator Hda [Woeseia sp.]NNE60499.1 DnaA regulatory inactivator Hda [Woeseia sp.]NNL54806.1 DnaA regulatory inactivator Hda [Woeseia sp.]
MTQLALPLQLADHAVFDSFWPAANEALVAYLQKLVGQNAGPGCWIWGEAATGKTHLLQAACARGGDQAMYLPLAFFQESGPAVLEGAGLRPLICIDDADAIAGRDEWESALFDLYNQVADADGTLVVASSHTVRESGFAMPDLQSRFTQLTTFHIQPLDEDDRVQALQLRARHRGLELPDETARFMLNRSRRDMASLYSLLDRLDAAALQAKRRLTVPFVRDVLQQQMPG